VGGVGAFVEPGHDVVGEADACDAAVGCNVIRVTVPGKVHRASPSPAWADRHDAR
jgi:hypothetical protein